MAKEAREEGIKQGIQQGRQEGRKYITDILIRQFNDKKISAKEGADYLGVTVKEFLDLVN